MREKIEQLSKELNIVLEDQPKVSHLIKDFINNIVDVCGQQTKTVLIKYNDELMNYLQENYQTKPLPK